MSFRIACPMTTSVMAIQRALSQNGTRRLPGVLAVVDVAVIAFQRMGSP
jgi:hypothetical protein